MRIFAATFGAASFALVFSTLFALLACYLGVLFSGVDTFIAILTATGFCVVVILVTALALKRQARRLVWRSLLIAVMLLALIVVSLMSWFGTRDKLKLFVNPVPSSLHVLQGRSLLFGCYVHFSAPPAVIAAIIHSKQLTTPTEADNSGQAERERMKAAWGWWQPAAMQNPTFLLRHHTSEAVQGWTEGLWVNDATNEVYAFISG